MNYDHENDIQQEQQSSEEHMQQAVQQDAEIDHCKQEVAQWKEHAARIFADFDNYKKRTEKEQVSWMQTAQMSILKDLLPVVDNFDRALAAKTEENAALYAGIEMINKSVFEVLRKYGVQEFTSYTTFDPELHEALNTQEAPGYTTGQIVHVYEKGFMLKDKVLRPAKVIVAK